MLRVAGLIAMTFCFVTSGRAGTGTCEVNEMQKLTAPDAGTLDLFGIPVSTNGNTIVVGARLDDCETGSACESAYVFRPGGIYEQALVNGVVGIREFVPSIYSASPEIRRAGFGIDLIVTLFDLCVVDQGQTTPHHRRLF